MITDVIASRPPRAVVHSQSRKTGVIPEDIELKVLNGGRSSESESDNGQFPPPTEEEQLTLRKVHGSIPWVAWLLCVVELAERASYYGASGIFSNFIQFPLPPVSRVMIANWVLVG